MLYYVQPRNPNSVWLVSGREARGQQIWYLGLPDPL